MESRIKGIKVNCEQEPADKYFSENGDLIIETEDQPKTLMENNIYAAENNRLHPPKVMTFEPTWEEFKDFGRYIKFMEDQGAHQAGIAKIKPPPEYQPTDAIKLQGLHIDGIIKHLKVKGQNGELVVSSPPMGYEGVMENGSEQGQNDKTTTIEDFETLAKSDPHKPPQVPNECLESLFWYMLDHHGLNPLMATKSPGTLMRENTCEWNLNNLSSVLTILKRYQPKVCESSLAFGTWGSFFAWHSKNYELYSVNYLHKGSAQWWYCIPPSYARRFEELAKKKTDKKMQTCAAFLRHKQVIFTIEMLSSHGIPYDKVIQNQGEIIITFPYCYHSGFSTGFNIAESVHFGTERWIDYAKFSKICPCPGSNSLWLRSLIKKFQPDHYEKWKKGEDVGHHPEFPDEKMRANSPTNEEMKFDEEYFEVEKSVNGFVNNRSCGRKRVASDDEDYHEEDDGYDNASDSNESMKYISIFPQVNDRVLRSTTKNTIFGKRINREDACVTPKKGKNQSMEFSGRDTKRKKLSGKTNVGSTIGKFNSVRNLGKLLRRMGFEASGQRGRVDLELESSDEQQECLELETWKQNGSPDLDDGRFEEDSPQPSTSRRTTLAQADWNNNFRNHKKRMVHTKNLKDNASTDYKTQSMQVINTLWEELEDKNNLVKLESEKRVHLEGIIRLLGKEIELKDRSIKRFRNMLMLEGNFVSLISNPSNGTVVGKLLVNPDNVSQVGKLVTNAANTSLDDAGTHPGNSSPDGKVVSNPVNGSPNGSVLSKTFNSTTKKPFPCDQCDKSYGSMSALKNHITAKHSDASFTCNKCNTKCSNKYTLLRHYEFYCPSRSSITSRKLRD